MLEDLIKNRKSVRKYTQEDISKENLRKILQAGYLAPSWMNSQPWRFILVKNQETKDLLSELSGHQPHVKSANALIVCIADKNAWDKREFGEVLKGRGMSDEGIDKVCSIPLYYPVLLGNERVLMRSVEQVTYAVSYMMLQAKELGVDSCIIGAIQNEATVQNKPELIEKVNEVLGLEKGQVIITIMTLGYSAEDKEPNKLRKDFDKVVHFEKIGQKF